MRILNAVALLCAFKGLGFYEKVLQDFSNYSYFVSVRIDSPEYTGRAVIQNGDLFYFMYRMKMIKDKQGYISFMGDKLAKDCVLVLQGQSLVEDGFLPVMDTCLSIPNQGQLDSASFVKYYFRGIALKDSISACERYAVIDRLFYWKLPCKMDDETGYLIIHHW